MTSVNKMEKLKLGIIGISETIHTSNKDLSQLTTNTLNFNPLGKIIKLTQIEAAKTTPPEDHLQEKAYALQKKADIVAIIEEDTWVHYDKKTKLIYSNPDSINLAHEIGHKLGLTHPTFSCGQFCDRYYAENKCQFSREIMGCAGALGETTGFSKADTTTLTKNYLT